MSGLLSIVGPGLVLAGYVIALLLHRAGRSPRPGWIVVAAGFGLVIGLWLLSAVAVVAFAPFALAEFGIAFVAPLLILPVLLVALARRGARRVAGLLLAAAAVPWILAWMGALDVFGGVQGARVLGSDWMLLGVGMFVVGIALVVLRDPGADPTSPEVRARRRRIGAFGAAIMDRARLGHLSPALLATILAAAVIQGAPALRGVVGVALVVAVAVLVTELELRLVPRSVRPALEAFHTIGRGELVRFARITGRPLPVTKGAATTYLATPSVDGDLGYRAELLVWRDRRQEALAVVGRMPERTPAERLDKALAADYVAWSGDGLERGIDFAGLAATIEDDEERLRADGLLAYRASLHGFASGEPDWLAPLTAFRSRLGPAADGLHPRAMRKVTLIPAIGLAVLVSLFTLWPG